MTFLRLFLLVGSGQTESGITSNSLSLVIDESRGYIYDCNMSPLVNEGVRRIAVISPDASVLPYIKDALSEDDFSYVCSRISKGYPAYAEAKRDIKCDGVKMINVFSRLSDDVSLCHMIGYLSGAGDAVCGIEKGYDEMLSAGDRTCSVRFSVDAAGRVLLGEEPVISFNDYYDKNGVCLTIDRKIQHIAEAAMRESGFERGAAVVSDVKTGEVKALYSMPTYDPRNISEYLNSENSPFINRALTPFSVGSVFKMIVASAALESGVSERLEYDCTGKIEESGTVFHCHKRDGHGVLDMRGALKNSCNTYFIDLVQKLDMKDVTELACYMGLGSENKLCEGITCASGVVPDGNTLISDAEKANIAFGQGKLTASPLQIAAATAVIASGGFYTEPYLVKSLVDRDGNEQDVHEKQFRQRVVSERTAEKVRDMLIYAEKGREDGTKYTTAGGKTSTAQSGIYKDGREQLNTWYSGFFPADDPRYVVTVMIEGGSSGTFDCRPIFNKIADMISALYPR